MPEHTNLATALAAMQAELPKLRKTETAKVTGENKNGGRVNYSYGYAGLDEVVETVLPVLGAHGLSVTSKTVIHETMGFVLEVKLLHTSGENEVGVWLLPDPRRAGPQDIGSAMTYGRRYLTLALTGTFPGGEDDDGAKAQASSNGRGTVSPEEFQNLSRERPRQQAPQNAPTSPAAPPASKKEWANADVVELHTKLDALDLDKAGALYDWMAARDLHNRLADFGGDVPPVSGTTRLAVRLATLARDSGVVVENLSWIREFADGRGLLKTPVSPKSNLDEVLTAQKAALTAAKVEQSDNAQAMRAAAEDSWNAPAPDGADLRIDPSDPATLP